MQAHRVHVSIPEDHKATIEVPAEVPAVEAEVIVLSSASVRVTLPASLSAPAEWRIMLAEARCRSLACAYGRSWQ
jgi:hypothetical protein